MIASCAQIAAQHCTLEPLLPLILWLNGQPYTLRDYAPFRTIFRLDLPRKVLIKAGRQVGKTTSMAALTVIRAAAIPYHKIMIVLPYRNQSSNVSDTYYKQFINGSPIKNLLIDTGCKKATLYKDFKNGSRIVFRYASDDPTTLRSYTNDFLVFDEYQDFDESLIPVVEETTTASNWRQELFTGTPLTLDNPIETTWQQTTKHEWLVKCERCNFWNIPSLQHHLEQMIGPYREDISPESPATICARCGRPINPRFGEWVPEVRDQVGIFHGYHVPQIIIPMHFEDPERWRELLEKQRTRPRAIFLREVLGESYEDAAVPLTIADLTAVADLGTLSIELALERNNEYVDTVFGIDWGGGSVTGESLTTIVYAGLTQDYRIEIPWAIKLPPQDPIKEADAILSYFDKLRPSRIVHDFTGGIGSLRETILRNKGVPPEIIIPIYLVSSTTNYMVLPVYAPHRSRVHYKVDRTRMLQHLIGSIKARAIRFFNMSGDAQNLLGDFLNLAEERQVTSAGRETYRIIRRRHTSDDFAMAVGLATVHLWQLHDAWPQFMPTES